ncbi:MAG: 2-hydroxyacyl-CoA dehydratase family protein [Thermodesulfobacteriota bacterium]|nr:2-hydroxyacyl-CoA dehydratase family protein [Thermodesulfobacteriota bacterium]
MFNKFHEIFQARHEYAESYPRKKVMGCMCTLVPEELIYAAGFLPVRLMGGHQPQTIADPYIPPIFCSYCRDLLSQGLKGRYHYLKGLVHTNSCEKIRSAFESWQRHIAGMKTYFLWMPQVLNHCAIEIFLSEVRYLKEQLEHDWKVNINDEDLIRAIDVYNENRRLMKRVYELAREVPSRISGEELMSMVLASQVIDKEEHNQLVREFIKVTEGRRQGEQRVRVMIVGQTSGDLQLVQLLDALGGNVVVDETCFGARYFFEEIESKNDPLVAIASRYIRRLPCPIKDGDIPRKRIPFILELARIYKVQFALLVYPTFCDSHSYDNPIIREALLKEGIKVLELAEDFPLPIGQLRTRIEATLESVDFA